MVCSSENVLVIYLHFTWLYGSWNHQWILKRHLFWKYDGWFSSELPKPTSVRNKLIMSLKHWFMEAKNVLDHVMVPKDDQNIIERQYWLHLVREINIMGQYWWKSIFVMPENVWFQGYFAEVGFGSSEENQPSYFQKRCFSKILWWFHEPYNQVKCR